MNTCINMQKFIRVENNATVLIHKSYVHFEINFV